VQLICCLGLSEKHTAMVDMQMYELELDFFLLTSLGSSEKKDRTNNMYDHDRLGVLNNVLRVLLVV
jgi:hypothetical protein